MKNWKPFEGCTLSTTCPQCKGAVQVFKNSDDPYEAKDGDKTRCPVCKITGTIYTIHEEDEWSDFNGELSIDWNE